MTEQSTVLVSYTDIHRNLQPTKKYTIPMRKYVDPWIVARAGRSEFTQNKSLSGTDCQRIGVTLEGNYSKSDIRVSKW